MADRPKDDGSNNINKRPKLTNSDQMILEYHNI